jgi:hypothetical protein
VTMSTFRSVELESLLRLMTSQNESADFPLAFAAKIVPSKSNKLSDVVTSVSDGGVRNWSYWLIDRKLVLFAYSL